MKETSEILSGEVTERGRGPSTVIRSRREPNDNVVGSETEVGPYRKDGDT